jgi:hypothetical protein
MAATFLDVKRPEREACRSSPSSAEGKNAGAILAFPIRLHGVVTCLLYLTSDHNRKISIPSLCRIISEYKVLSTYSCGQHC